MNPGLMVELPLDTGRGSGPQRETAPAGADSRTVLCDLGFLVSGSWDHFIGIAAQYRQANTCNVERKDDPLDVLTNQGQTMIV